MHVIELTKKFVKFYAAVHPGRVPYAWQKRLLAFIVREGRWPDTIAAPTGAGKTSVLYVHVFLNAMVAGGQVPARIPRRLVLSVDRRALVDSQFDEAERLAQVLTTADDGILQDVRIGLEARAADGPVTEESFLVRASIRGGSHDERTEGRTSWRLQPTACAILCMTPDMFGSRLLFRGYGASNAARPVEAGLLAYDTVLIVDEAHLNRQLVKTARRIEQLERLAEVGVGRPVLQVVETTATPDEVDGLAVIGVESSDFDDDEELDRRLCRPKPVRVVDIEHALTDKRSVEIAVAECFALRAESFDGTVGCIVNSVDAAVRITAALKAYEPTALVRTFVGRMRPVDRSAAMEQFPELFGRSDGASDAEARETPAPRLDFLVATQTMEVGVDADFVGLVTELAPATALAQRAGRVNRRGLRNEGRIVVLAPRIGQKIGIYEPGDLTQAREWLDQLDYDGLVVAKVKNPPGASPRRVLWQRLEEWDAEYFAATDEVMAAEDGVEGSTSLELYLSDDLEADFDASLVVRGGLPKDDSLAERVLEAMPVRDGERFPVSVGILRDAVQAFAGEDRHRHPRMFRLVRNDSGALRVRIGTARDIVPGDTIIVDAHAPLFREGVPVREGSETVKPVDSASEGAFNAVTVISLEADRREWLALADEYTAILSEDEESARTFVRERIQPRFRDSVDPVLRAISESDSIDLLVGDGDAPTEIAIVASDADEVELDEERRQRSTSRGGGRVPLADHQREVGRRASSLAGAHGLEEYVAVALHQAGLLHDEGKRDGRFQTELGAKNGVILAKSGRRPSRRLRAALGLTGWRHEQRSAAHVWAVRDTIENADAELVTRLVGTSHGHGRGAFRDDAATLLPSSERADPALWQAAVDLFDAGEWEALIERTHRRYGYWGVAYLEAILRVADMTTSAEGK